MKPRARRGCTQATRQADSATRSGRRRRPQPIRWPGGAASHKAEYRRTSRKRRPSLPRPARGRPKHSNEAPRDGKIRAPCMIRGARAAKRAPPWQDLRAMHSRKAICGAFRMHGARILPKPARFGCTAAICCQGGALSPSEAPSGMHEARILPRIAARERTRAKYCHRRAPENAPWRHGAGGQRANETSANSTPRADASKKP